MRLSGVAQRCLAVALLAVLAVLALAACGDDGEGKPAPAEGPVFRTGMIEDIKTTNFWSYFGPDTTVYTGYVFECQAAHLYRYSEQRWDWVPDLAIDLPSDLLQEGPFWVTTVRLQDGATWSDGQPMTAQHAVFTWHTVRDLEITDGNWAAYIPLDFFDHAEAIDATTLKVFFKEKPGLPVWQFGLAMSPILPKHYWEPVVEQAKASNDPVATLYAHDGSKAPGAECNLARREPGAFVENREYRNHFKAGTTIRQYENGAYQEEGPRRNFILYGQAKGQVSLEFQFGPHTDNTLYNVYADQDSALLALQQGDFDYWLNPLSLPKGLADQLAATQALQIISNPANGFRYLGFNFRVPPLNDPAFRKAVALLIDKEFVTQEVLQGQALAVYGFVPEGNAFWFNPNAPKPGQGLTREERIEQATEILKAAGYTWAVEPAWDPEGPDVNPQGSGLKMPDGTPVPTLRLAAPSAGYDPLRSTFAIWIAQWLSEFGIPVAVQLLGFNVLVSKIFEEQDIDMWIFGWGLTPFPDHMAAFFDCKAADPGGFNAGGYCSSEFQALIDEFQTETSIERARELVFRQQELLAEDLPYVVLFTTPIVEAFRSSAVQFPYTEELDGLQGVHYGLQYAVRVL